MKLLISILLVSTSLVTSAPQQGLCQTNQASKPAHKNDPPVHQYITYEAYKMLQGSPAYSEFSLFIGDYKQNKAPHTNVCKILKCKQHQKLITYH